MNKDKKKRLQVFVAIMSAVLCILWLFVPGWHLNKILGLIASALLCLSMYISYQEGKKNKDC